MTDWLQTASPASAAQPARDKRRLALDGEAYTFEEFATYYGFENGVAIWRKSECLDSAEPPVAITASDPEDSAEVPVAITASSGSAERPATSVPSQPLAKRAGNVQRAGA